MRPKLNSIVHKKSLVKWKAAYLDRLRELGNAMMMNNLLNRKRTFGDKSDELNGTIRTRKMRTPRELLEWGNDNIGDRRAAWKPWKATKVQEVKKEDSTNKEVDEEDIGCCTSGGLKVNVRQYLLKTTLHGLRYIGDARLSIIERLFWFVSVFLAMVVAAYFIGNIYEKWDTAPMIVSLNPETAPITSIPFPAVTICNTNMVKKSVATKILNEGTAVEKKLLENTCNINNDSAVLDNMDSTKAGEWASIKKFFINVAQPCNQLLAACRWKDEPRSCETLFNAALTDEGLCCTFNSVHREMMFRKPRELSDLNITFPFPAVDWTPENGYPPDAPTNGFPWRPIGAGAHLGLTLVLDAAINEYYCASTNGVGFKILLHNPSETPKIADFGDLITPGFETRLVVRPRIHDAQPQLKNIALKKRKCYFSSERQLVYYRTYTQKNCVLECEARLTIEKCNCSLYYMPKNSSIRICGMADYRCYIELKIAIDDKLGVNESAIMVTSNCDDCYPSCNELSYGKEASMIPLVDTFGIKEEILAGKTPEYFIKNIGVLQIYFVENSFIRFTKGELFGFTDFLSNTGGLLGLFLGFSFLSFVEIIYFLSLRILCAYLRHHHRKTPAVFPFSQ